MFSFIRRMTTTNATPRLRERRRGFHPRLELLEDRCVPAQIWAVHIGLDSVDMKGTLRYAIDHAADGDAIKIASDVDAIDLTQGGLVINKHLTIGVLQLPSQAASPAQLNHIVTLSSSIDPRFLIVETTGSATFTGVDISGFDGTDPSLPGFDGEGGAILNFGTLTLNSCNLFDNSAASQGGAIANFGTLTLNNCTVYHNTAGNGGGIYNEGTVTVNGGAVSGNSAFDGGGISNLGALGAMTLSSTTLSGNKASQGGGVFNLNGTVTVSDTTMSANSTAVYPSVGGAICNFFGTVTVSDSTLTGNKAGSGGAIFSQGTLTISGSILSNNLAASGGGINGSGIFTISGSTLSDNSAGLYGGGIFIFRGSLTISGSTLSDNSAGILGGGICDFDDAPVTVSASTFSGNSASEGGGIYMEFGVLTVKDFSTIVGNFGFGADVFNDSPFAVILEPGSTIGDLL